MYLHIYVFVQIAKEQCWVLALLEMPIYQNPMPGSVESKKQQILIRSLLLGLRTLTIAPVVVGF